MMKILKREGNWIFHYNQGDYYFLHNCSSENPGLIPTARSASEAGDAQESLRIWDHVICRYCANHFRKEVRVPKKLLKEGLFIYRLNE